MIHPPASADGIVRIRHIRSDRVTPIRPVAAAVGTPGGADTGEERRSGTDRRQRGIPVPFDTRGGERRARLLTIRC